MATRSRRLVLGAFWVVLVVFFAVFGLWAAQRRLIYIPDHTRPELGAMGDTWEEVTLHTSDGLALSAWYRPPEPERPVVVVFSGNGGNRGDRADLGSRLAGHGLGVLLTDYRGYGGNPGHPTEEGLARDARAAVTFLENELAGHPIVYFGESLSAAVAIELAVDEPPTALVLRSPFTSLVAVGRVHYPWAPVGLLLKDQYPSDERIGLVSVPTFVIAGDRDSIVPPAQSFAIYEAAPEPKRLLVIEGTDHNHPELVAGAGVINEIVAFIDG